MTSRDPKGAVMQYGRLSWRQFGFLYEKCVIAEGEETDFGHVACA